MTDMGQTRQIEAFGRKVSSTASQMMDPTSNVHYQHAISELQKELRRPGLQQRVFSYAQASPTEMVRSRLSTSEIQHRALTYIPDEILHKIPPPGAKGSFSLFQGFQATIPQESASEQRRGRQRKRIEGPVLDDPSRLEHQLEMMGVRKNMCSAEIQEIDAKIANFQQMRCIVLDRLESLEQDELAIEQKLQQVEATIQTMPPDDTETPRVDDEANEETFMSASILEKLPSPVQRQSKRARRKTTAIRHGHFEPGSRIAKLEAHSDKITALDFDVPFGTMISSGLDDTVRVWDLNAGRCLGLLEGHQASIRCLQIEDNVVATGSMDASIRLWDLNLAQQSVDEEADRAIFDTSECHVHSLTAHVAEITAVHMQGTSLVSGSADKTMRQWDLVKGRCVQTLDVLWAAAQASSAISPNASSSDNITPTNLRPIHARATDASADFIGALQCFDAALACGTGDGMVRLWDLRSGQVHRSLVGHTGPITCLQFDERHLITGSADRSIRVGVPFVVQH